MEKETYCNLNNLYWNRRLSDDDDNDNNDDEDNDGNDDNGNHPKSGTRLKKVRLTRVKDESLDKTTGRLYPG